MMRVIYGPDALRWKAGEDHVHNPYKLPFVQVYYHRVREGASVLATALSDHARKQLLPHVKRRFCSTYLGIWCSVIVCSIELSSVP